MKDERCEARLVKKINWRHQDVYEFNAQSVEPVSIFEQQFLLNIIIGRQAGDF